MTPSRTNQSERLQLLRARLRRRAGLIVVLLVAVLLIVALLLYDDSTQDDDQGKRSPRTGTATPTSSRTSARSSTSSAPGGASDTATLPALPGIGTIPNVNTTRLSTLPPGQHRVVVRVSSDAALLGVAYAFKGDRAARQVSNVKSPVVFVRTLSGQRPYASVVFQAGPTATGATCHITIDGKVVSSGTTSRGYGTAGCIG